MATYPQSTAPASVRWRAGSLTATVADGAQVDTLASEGDQAVTLTQGTAASRPLLRHAVTELGGKAALDFDGTDDRMVSSTSLVLTATSTWFLAWVPKTGTAVGQPWFVTNAEFFWNTDGGWGAWVSTSLFANDALVRGSGNACTLLYAGASSQVYLGGTLSSSGNPGSAAVSAAATLGDHGSEIRRLPGFVAELVILDYTPTADQRSAVHSYFQDEYGITVADYVPSIAMAKVAPASTVTAAGWTAVGKPTHHEALASQAVADYITAAGA